MSFHGLPQEAMSKPAQISATISTTTKEQLDQFTATHGLRKNFVVEQALLFFMQARRELPDEALLPARIVIEDNDFDRLVRSLDQAPAPTAPLRKLLRGRRG